MSIGSPAASFMVDASACWPSCPSALTAWLSTSPKSAAPGAAALLLAGSFGVSALSALPTFIGICYSSGCRSGATKIDGPLGHLLDRVQHRHIGLVGAAGRQHVGHLSGGGDV